MARTALRRPLSAAVLAAIAAPALAGPTTAYWAAPVSGGFYDPANWTGGVGPQVGADMIIDAVGQPYTVGWIAAFGVPRVNSFLLDSHDARVIMRGGERFNNTDFRVAGDTVIRRGVLDLNGQIFGTGALRIESGGTLDIQNGPSGSGFRGAQLALDVFNAGEFIVRGGATLSQIRTSGVLPSGIRIVNEQSGTMRFEGGNLFTAGVLDNHGLIVLENDPQFNGAPPLNTDGVSFGPLGYQPTSFNNYGTVRVEQGQFSMGNGIHSGTFHLAQAASTMTVGGSNSFLPGATITGPGLTRIQGAADVTGLLRIESDLELESFTGAVNTALDVDGALILDLQSSSVDFNSLVVAGLVTGDLNRAMRFHAAADVAFEGAIGSAEFFAPAIVRGDLFSQGDRSVFHHNANITGSVDNAAFMRDAVIGGDARNVEFQLGATIGGDLTRGATALGRVNVDGNVIATSGSWLFTSDGGAAIHAFLDVAGDVTITRPFSIDGDIIARGDFSTNQGRFGNITADTVTFGTSTSSSAGTVTLYGRAFIETSGSRAIIQRAVLGADFGDGPTGFETVTFVNGFEVVYIPVTQFTRSGFNIVVNADTSRATAFHFLADSILAGTLDVSVIGDASNLSFGDSFTILAGSHPFDPANPVATLTGEFDRLFLPSLPGDLFFDVVYEPSAVRLVVVPAPGAAAILSLSAIPFARRSRTAASNT